MLYKNLMNKDMKYVPKGWGYELWIDNNDLYCGKRLFFIKGKRLSLHYHKIKNETFYVQSGKLDLVVYMNEGLDSWIKDWMFFDRQLVDDWSSIPMSLERPELYRLEEGDTFKIPVGLRHTAIALQDTQVLEFSTPHYDEDSYRVLKGD